MLLIRANVERLELKMGNFVESGMFVRRLTVIAASVLARSRRLFPADCFEPQRFFGTDVTMLRNDVEDKAARFLQQAVNEALEAFDRRYLRKMVISLYANEEQPQTILESFYFQFYYKPEHQPPLTDDFLRSDSYQQQLATVRVTTRQLLERLQECEAPALPKVFDIVVRLFYTEETPAEYQARGYVTDVAAFAEASARDRLALGDVRTPYHRLAVKKYRGASTLGAGAGATPPTPAPRHATPAPSGCSTPDSDASRASSFASGSSSRSAASSETLVVRCPCTRDDPAGGHFESPLVVCPHCRRYQHAACFGVRAEDVAAAEEAHCCERCAREDPALTCSDPNFVEAAPGAAAQLCMLRRTLEWCALADTRPMSLRIVTARMLVATFAITYNSAQKMIAMLQQEAMVLLPSSAETCGMDTIYMPNPSKARREMAKWFRAQRPCDASLSDRVYEQYQRSSQESRGEEEAGALLPPPPPPDCALATVLHVPRGAELVAPRPSAAAAATAAESPAKRTKTCATIDDFRKVVLAPSPPAAEGAAAAPGARRKGARGGRGRGRGRGARGGGASKRR